MRRELREILDFAKVTAAEAGKLIAEARAGNNVSYRYKNDIELVSTADEASDRFIRSEIQGRFPSHQVLSEEGENSLSGMRVQGPLWIVDPIDGTVNYSHGHSQVAVSIAYAEGGVVQAGVVHNPFQGETFTAVKGGGAWLNDERIQVSHQSDLKHALIGTGFPYDRSDLEPVLRKLRAVLLNCQGVRRAGSGALDICWVADGRLDGFYESLSPWDIAAAALVAEEAGATKGHLGPPPDHMPVDFYGRDLIVATPEIFEALVRVLQSSS